MSKITIPLGKNTPFHIPAKVTPKSERNDVVERIGVSADKAAAMLDISVRKVWQLAKEGKIRTVRVGKRRIFSVRSIREFIDGENASGFLTQN